MRFSLQVHYAVCGVFDLAYNGLDQAVQVRVIGERQSIPTRYLEQIFQRLRRAELVTGKRGPGGGYRLARPPAEISLRDVVEAIEGPVGGSAADADELEAERPAPGGRPDFIWPELSARLGQVLADVSLADLCQQAARAGVPRLVSQPADYQI